MRGRHAATPGSRKRSENGDGPMSTEPEPPHISMKAAVKLTGWKPVKNQTRKDLVVFGGWLTSRWEWSRDVDVPLDTAIANSRRLGEDVRVVGEPKPADRKKVRGRKPLWSLRPSSP